MSEAVNQNMLRRVYDWIASAGPLWPSRCLVCGEACPGRGRGEAPISPLEGICPPCARALPWNRHACDRCALSLPAIDAGTTCGACLRRPPPLAVCHAAFVYGFPLDRLLPRAKFHKDLAASRQLGRWMAGALEDLLAADERPQAVVPLPLHRGRLRGRGYDQALELTRPLARRLGLPLRDDLLRRVRATAPQSRQDAAGRRRNLRNAFIVPAGVAVPAHVAIVDDVMTTGATLHAAASALRRAGVARVDAWVCARVP